VVVSLEPSSLADVLGDVRRVAEALGVPQRGAAVVAALEQRVEAVRARTRRASRPRCVILEWIDPPYRGGHWNPELVEIAGGVETLGRAGEDAARVPWEAVLEAAPDVLVLACCGYDVPRTRADLPLLRSRAGWSTLPAVRNAQVWIVDGSAYFSRPGPRIVDSLELLGALLHPELFAGEWPPGAVERAAA
jgi:iron complex transport system substrate-binding protein